MVIPSSGERSIGRSRTVGHRWPSRRPALLVKLFVWSSSWDDVNPFEYFRYHWQLVPIHLLEDSSGFKCSCVIAVSLYHYLSFILILLLMWTVSHKILDYFWFFLLLLWTVSHNIWWRPLHGIRAQFICWSVNSGPLILGFGFFFWFWILVFFLIFGGGCYHIMLAGVHCVLIVCSSFNRGIVFLFFFLRL